jgi:homoserine trans-succinylase
MRVYVDKKLRKWKGKIFSPLQRTYSTPYKTFLKEIGEISQEKYNKYINTLIPREKQKYNRLDKYNQILQCLKWP